MTYEYGNWFLVAGASALFLFFLFDAFKPKTKTDWRTFGSLAAFIIALFTEMFGFPLTMYLLTSWFGSRIPALNFSHSAGHLWETLLGTTGDPHWSILHIISNILIFGGIILIAAAWKILYQASQKNSLATTGPYQYIRHPQYVGFIFLIVGFLLQWPTIITLLMAPILIIRYARLAHEEEQTMMLRFGTKYKEYRHRVPGWTPSFSTFFEKSFSVNGGVKHG